MLKKIALPFIIILFLFSCKKTSGQNESNKDNDINKIFKQYITENQTIENKEEIDFDNDNEKELIITTSDTNATTIFEYWFKNEKLLYKISYPWVEINKKWIVNLDDDQQSEIIRAMGFEDGVNYIVYDFQNSKQIPILYFNSLIQDAKKLILFSGAILGIWKG